VNPFLLNRHGKLVFPSNIIPELDFSTVDSLDQLDQVIRRDFEAKAPTGTDILERITTVGYPTKDALLRDLAMNLFWVNRFAITMYDKRPTRWGDLPRARADVYLPVVEPWTDADRKVAAVREAYPTLPGQWDPAAEDRIFDLLFDVYGHRKNQASTLPALRPTVAEFLHTPGALTFRLGSYDPDYPVFDYEQIVDCSEDVPEIEALHRWAMVLHNQYPWDRAGIELVTADQLRADDYVVAFHPRSAEVRGFLRRLRTAPPTRAGQPAAPSRPPVAPYAAVDVRRFEVAPKLESLAAVHGELACSNDDVIRNTAYNWSPMSAAEIHVKTGIEERRYTQLDLEELALRAATAALAKAGRAPEEIGAVLVCTCTSARLIPSMATYLCGQLGIHQVHAAYDIVAACAGMPYGLGEAIRLLQEVRRPVLVVCAEKFSDKIGNVRTSRMIFGDGAAAMVLGVAPEGEAPSITHFKTYASGPASEVNAILWPNPEFDNNITVYGPEVKSLAGRYLTQMIEELTALPDPDGRAASLLDSIDLIVPHQANKTMVIDLARRAGVSPDSLYFNIAKVGNASSASIPLAIHDAVRDGIIGAPMRIFAPGFGAGAVAGYTVIDLDPAIVAIDHGTTPNAHSAHLGGTGTTNSDDIQTAFG
jgi:3-oxoacyl-[acyl-carrier-protein] synthase III